ncbi:hypothetical protein [Thermoanaerobacterium thermosulfurigenes]|uniref:hypothetical protein n=1 Tax=Thermoanaerobacterium thermosulfurigenes TaxID=33950 RepID=UPI003EF18A58
MIENEKLVTYEPIAEYFKCSTYQIKKLWQKGLIKEKKMKSFHDFGKTFKYPVFDLNEIIKNENYIKNFIKTKKQKIRELEITPQNIAESLYIINKSAKKSRDSKQKNYDMGNYGITARCKDREQYLYTLKDKVIKKILDLNWGIIKGYHTQEREYYYETEIYVDENDNEVDLYSIIDDEEENYIDDEYLANEYRIKVKYITNIEIEINYLLLIEFCNFTFHIPTDEKGVNNYDFLGKIDKIPAEKTVKTNIKYTEAVNLLENFISEDKKIAI